MPNNSGIVQPLKHIRRSLLPPARVAYLLQFGFDTDGPTEVRIGYAELICNNFR
jgi:hypothetical protein